MKNCSLCKSFLGGFLSILLAFSMVPSAAFAAVEADDAAFETGLTSASSINGQNANDEGSHQDPNPLDTDGKEEADAQKSEPDEAASPEDEGGFADAVDSQLEDILNAEPANLDGDYAQNEVIIVYVDEMLDEDAPLDLAEGVEGITLGDIGVVDQEIVVESQDNKMAGDISVAKLDDMASVEQAIASISEVPGVAYVQPNYEYTTEAVTPQEVQVHDPRLANQYYLDSTKTRDAWRYKTTSNSVTVAVVDSGCNLQHEDLQDNLLADLAWDCVRNKKLVETASVADNYGDAFGHGTMVSGVIAAKANNGKGIAGTSYDAKILPIRVMDNSDKTYTSYLINALKKIEEYAESGKGGNLKIVNMSLGGYVDDPTFHYWVSRLHNNYGMTIVCAGGNGDKNNNPITAPCYPSDYAECIGVTALTQNGAHAYWSDYNPQKDISAPGVDIISTTNDGGYGFADGSSFSAPIVSGVAAMLLAACPDASSSDIYRAVRESASAIVGAQRPSNGSAGAVNAIGALAYLGIDTSAIYNWTPYYESGYLPIYSYGFYRNAFADLRSAFGYDRRSFLNHYVNCGMAEGRRASDSFDVASYYNANPDLRAAFGTNLKSLTMHYVNYGKREGRRAAGVRELLGHTSSRGGVSYAAVYDGARYASGNGDVRAACTRRVGAVSLLDDQALLAHYVNYGMAEGRRASASFDVASYYNANPDLRRAFGTDLRALAMHYVSYGSREGRRAFGVPELQGYVARRAGADYSAVYDGAFYRRSYGDLKATFSVRKPSGMVLFDDTALLAHYVNCGMAEGRRASASFDVHAYWARYADVRAVFGSDLKACTMHYVNYGVREGRKGA